MANRCLNAKTTRSAKEEKESPQLGEVLSKILRTLEEMKGGLAQGNADRVLATVETADPAPESQ